jgi:hypothetical protein
MIHMIDDKPRNGRDVRVPGPIRTVRVAVFARAIKNRRNLRRDSDVMLDRVSGFRDGIGTRWSHELNAREDNYERYQNNFQNLY